MRRKFFAKRISNKVVIDKLLQENIQLKLNIDKAIAKIENCYRTPIEDDLTVERNRAIYEVLEILKNIGE